MIISFWCILHLIWELERFPVKSHHLLTKDLFIIRVENEKIISQIVWISEACDQSGDRVSKKDKRCRICSMRLKRYFSTNCSVATLPFTQFSPLGNIHIFTHATYHIISHYPFLRHLWCLLSKIPRHL